MFCFLFFPGYLLSWEAQGQKESRVKRTMSNSTLEYKVTGLTSLTTYTLEVAAMTGAGMGTLSSSTISSGVPPGEMLSTKKAPTAPLFQHRWFSPGSAIIYTHSQFRCNNNQSISEIKLGVCINILYSCLIMCAT